MKKYISIVCCFIFMSVATVSFAAESQEELKNSQVTLLIQKGQIEAQKTLLYNIINNLTRSAFSLEDQIKALEKKINKVTKQIELSKQTDENNNKDGDE